jgi:hypothetical protein
MIPLLSNLLRIDSWFCVAICLLNAGIIACNGLTAPRLGIQYRIVSLVAGSVYALIGGGIYFLERNIFAVQKILNNDGVFEEKQQLAKRWCTVHWILILTVGFVALVMCVSLFAIFIRLRDGSNVFG